MDILWAPWREAYVEKVGQKRTGCVFCQALKENKDKKNFIFLRSEHSFAILNIYPFNSGHSLVLPKRHVGDLEFLTEEERTDLMALLIRVKKMMDKAFKSEAFNIGLNLGHSAGAGIPEHMHFHIVPRWKGDVNFMPALFGTKVIPVSLKKTYERLKNADKNGHRKTGK